METAASEVGLTLRPPRAGLSRIIRYALAIVLAWSAGGKIFWPHRFGHILDEMGMIPPALLPAIQFGLPAVELLLAVTLAAGWMTYVSSLGTVFLSTVFSGVHAFALISGTVKSCGCAGVLIEYASWEFHLLLLALSLVMLCASLALLCERMPHLAHVTDTE